jgi:hypothetical protein
LLVDPTGILPKVTAAGLTLSAPEEVELVRLALELVMPVHPDWAIAVNNAVMSTKAARTREILYAHDGIRS